MKMAPRLLSIFMAAQLICLPSYARADCRDIENSPSGGHTTGTLLGAGVGLWAIGGPLGLIAGGVAGHYISANGEDNDKKARAAACEQAQQRERAEKRDRQLQQIQEELSALKAQTTARPKGDEQAVQPVQRPETQKTEPAPK